MALGHRRTERQEELWVETSKLPARVASHDLPLAGDLRTPRSFPFVPASRPLSPTSRWRRSRLHPRFGDWEGDTIHSGMIITCVKRKSGSLITAKMEDRTSERLNAAKERTFGIIPPELRRTQTVDNGKQLASHKRLSERLKMPIYFTHACSSKERATNENADGLLQQYSPKKTDFRDLSHHALAYVTERLKNRTRKRFNYLTPQEALKQAEFALEM